MSGCAVRDPGMAAEAPRHDAVERDEALSPLATRAIQSGGLTSGGRGPEAPGYGTVSTPLDPSNRKSSFVVYFASASPSPQGFERQQSNASSTGSPRKHSSLSSKSPRNGAARTPSMSSTSSHAPSEPAEPATSPTRTRSASTYATLPPDVAESDLAIEPFPAMGAAFMARLPEFSLNCTTPYKHQAGGARALTRYGKDKVAKPCTAREAWFYQNVVSGICPYAPGFHGLRRGQDGGAQVLLEDLARGFKRPCVLDVKMGVCTAAPDRTAAKRASCEEKDKITTTGSIGARVCGLRVYQVETEDYMMLDKHWGKQLSFQEFGLGIEKFFCNGRRTRRRLAGRFCERIQPILSMMRQRCRYKFYASSLLLIYEGEDGGEAHDEACGLDCRMIDFAHVFPSKTADESYICGLENFCRLLDAIAQGADLGDEQTIPYENHRGVASLHEHCRCAQWESGGGLRPQKPAAHAGGLQWGQAGAQACDE